MMPCLPTLHLTLRCTGSDLFGALEWALANARRTGLSLHSLRVGQDAATPIRLSVCAEEADLLGLFVRRLENGMDLEVLGADESHAAPGALALQAA